MKRFLVSLLAGLLMVGSVGLCEDELTYQTPTVYDDGRIMLEEDGMYKTGPDTDIPAGMYNVTSDGFSGNVFIPGASLVFTQGSTLLTPIEAQSFHADSGTYVAGVDFPAGIYSVRSAAEGTSSIIVYDTEGDLVVNSFLWEEKGERVGKCELLEGYTVEIGHGGAYFGAPGGITFD